MLTLSADSLNVVKWYVEAMDAVDQEIQTECSLGTPHRCPIHLRCYFRGPPTRILDKNALDRRLWLKTAQGIRQMITSLLVNHDGLSNERRLMRQWLAPPPLFISLLR